ncbi:uncharacterized protein LOC119676800 [Teleopsis dalmanni]|uniref:uncharacterized protein LOC119676792 n=1 Tax=Teleopsis dalmanni TaxID=139649 RepID=UPI0018CCB52C|nr:uncharacterized protein LOC119676792 [Teleopsis dalmanni]XP_037943986.1 uncharacterized protein LOC119676800 [Teleopsis dalmanni]
MLKMLCQPTMRPASPAESEISVGGAPSPLPQHHHLQRNSALDLLQHQQLLMQQHAAAAGLISRSAVGAVAEEYFQPLKRLRMSAEAADTRDRTPSPVQISVATTNATTTTAAANCKSNIEGVKSFSIADILGHEKRGSSASPPPPQTRTMATTSLLQPRTEPLDVVSAAAAAGVPHPAAAAMLLPTAQIVRPWDHLLGPMPVRPFIPPALLHYEQRLALDYHRQLQEHFNAQAQILRHMGMDIIPSESGSERSSSAASDCCSPEILRSSGESGAQTRHSPHTGNERERSGNSNSTNGNSASGSGNSSSNTGNLSSSNNKTKANGTPLDALFQMTTKDFDESQAINNLSLSLYLKTQN